MLLQILPSPFTDLFPQTEMWPSLLSNLIYTSHQGHRPSKDLGHCQNIFPISSLTLSSADNLRVQPAYLRDRRPTHMPPRFCRRCFSWRSLSYVTAGKAQVWLITQWSCSVQMACWDTKWSSGIIISNTPASPAMKNKITCSENDQLHFKCMF